MRIGMIMDTPFPPDARVQNEAKTLLEQGHEVCLFTIAYRDEPSRSHHEDIKIHRMRGSRLLYKLSALVWTVPFFQWLVRPRLSAFIRKSGVEALHVHDMVIAGAAFEANREFGLPLVLDLHENRPEILKFYPHVNRFPGRLLIWPGRWKKVQKRLMEQADQIILVTEEAREAAAADGISPEKITVLPNVVRPDDFKVRRGAANEGEQESSIGESPEHQEGGSATFTLLYIGDTSLRRGTPTAIEAVGQLTDQIPGLELIFVGDSSQDRSLRKLVQDKNLEAFVRFDGWQPPDRLPEYVLSADLCLSPLLRNPHHDTTYANKLFQYMAGGRAVVASDCPAQAAVVRREGCGLIHRAGEADDLADKILWLYRHPEERRKMGRNGYRAVQDRWNWSVTGSRLTRLYETISEPLQSHTTAE